MVVTWARLPSDIPHLFFNHADDLYVEVIQQLQVLQMKLILVDIPRHAQPLWPVLVTFDPSSLYLLGHHGNNIRFAFPHHLPEGLHCSRQGTLTGDIKELFISDMHANVAGVDVVLVLANSDAGLVI